MRQPKPRPEVDEDLWAILEAQGRERRRRQCLGIKAAAELAGVHPQYLADLESGRVANPTVATLRVWAKGLGMRLVPGVEPDDNGDERVRSRGRSGPHPRRASGRSRGPERVG